MSTTKVVRFANPRCAGFGRGAHRTPFVYVVGNAGYCAECYVALVRAHAAALALGDRHAALAGQFDDAGREAA